MQAVLRLARKMEEKPVEGYTRKECKPGEEAEIDLVMWAKCATQKVDCVKCGRS
jgi:hypothetical protein